MMRRLCPICSAFWLCCVLVFAVLLSSCGFTATGDTVSDYVRKYGAQSYDRGLENAEFFMCRAASVGSVLRRYFTDDDKRAAWVIICADVPSQINNKASGPDGFQAEQLVEWNIQLE